MKNYFPVGLQFYQFFQNTTLPSKKQRVSTIFYDDDDNTMRGTGYTALKLTNLQRQMSVSMVKLTAKDISFSHAAINI